MSMLLAVSTSISSLSVPRHRQVRWADDSLGSVEERDLELLDLARPDLTTVGTEIAGSLARPYGTLEYSLWPLVFSGFIRVRLPGPLLKRLDAQCDRLLEERRAPSHALFLWLGSSSRHRCEMM